MGDNIYLVGFMASGKSTVAGELGRVLKRKTIDMDLVLAKAFGAEIADVFRELGEPAFRKEETKLLERLASQNKLVVATGGGAAASQANLDIMKSSGAIIHLDAEFETCLRRTSEASRESRPKWGDVDSVRTLYETRREDYLKAGVNLRVDGMEAAQVSDLIYKELIGEYIFEAQLENRVSPVIATGYGPESLSRITGHRKIMVLTDKTVAKRHIHRYAPALGKAPVVAIKPGEGSKTMKTATRIYQHLLDHHYDRDDALVAIGGGVITDLGAFVASTYKRGMGSVLVSTTLLGCVDAAVGGKTAVNLGAAKNMVGTFHAPEAVILDLGSLGTLNKRGLMEGLVEAYKTGLIADEEFASHIELNGPDLLKGDQLGLAQVARRSAEIKAGIVGEDFTEKGKRMLLNFGHTYGHAVEAFYRHKVSHGRCVGLGMEVAARISLGRGMISEDLAERISRTISLLTPKPLAAPPAKDAWPLALQDKKIRNRGVVFILLKGPGQAEPVNDVTEQELDTAIKSVGRQRDG